MIEQGAIVQVLVLAGGTGYTSASVSVSSAAGSGATFTVTIASGSITAVNVNAGGTDYSDTTTLTITGNGTGAVIVPIVGTILYASPTGTDPNNLQKQAVIKEVLAGVPDSFDQDLALANSRAAALNPHPLDPQLKLIQSVPTRIASNIISVEHQYRRLSTEEEAVNPATVLQIDPTAMVSKGSTAVVTTVGPTVGDLETAVQNTISSPGAVPDPTLVLAGVTAKRLTDSAALIIEDYGPSTAQWLLENQPSIFHINKGTDQTNDPLNLDASSQVSHVTTVPAVPAMPTIPAGQKLVDIRAHLETPTRQLTTFEFGPYSTEDRRKLPRTVHLSDPTELGESQTIATVNGGVAPPGSLADVTVQSGGNGYVSPSITVGNLPTGPPAPILPTFNIINEQGTIAGVQVTSAGAYLSGPSISASAPTPTLAATTGGTLAANTYTVSVAYGNSTGRTAAGGTANITLASPDNAITVSTPASATGATLYYVYAGVPPPVVVPAGVVLPSTTTVLYLQNPNGTPIGTAWTINSLNVSGIAPSTVNTTQNTITLTVTDTAGTGAVLIPRVAPMTRTLLETTSVPLTASNTLAINRYAAVNRATDLINRGTVGGTGWLPEASTNETFSVEPCQPTDSMPALAEARGLALAYTTLNNQPLYRVECRRLTPYLCSYRVIYRFTPRRGLDPAGHVEVTVKSWAANVPLYIQWNPPQVGSTTGTVTVNILEMKVIGNMTLVILGTNMTTVDFRQINIAKMIASSSSPDAAAYIGYVNSDWFLSSTTGQGMPPGHVKYLGATTQSIVNQTSSEQTWRCIFRFQYCSLGYGYFGGQRRVIFPSASTGLALGSSTVATVDTATWVPTYTSPWTSGLLPIGLFAPLAAFNNNILVVS